MSGFAQCIGCAAQPHRATALAIAVRNDRMALPSQCADGVPRPASDRRSPLHGVDGGYGWWVSMVGWEEFLAISWQRPTPRCKPRSVFNWVPLAADDYATTAQISEDNSVGGSMLYVAVSAVLRSAAKAAGRNCPMCRQWKSPATKISSLQPTWCCSRRPRRRRPT